MLLVPFGGALVLVAVVLLAFGSSAAANRRVRNGLVALAISGVVVAGWAFLRFLRQDSRDHQALRMERKRLCGNVAASIDSHQNRFVRSEYKPPWTEHRAALSALQSMVSATWDLCVREDSECAALKPAMAIEASGERLDVVRRCFDQGPTPL